MKNIKLARDLKLVHSLSSQYQKATGRSSIVLKIDLQGRITYINDEFCKIFGYIK